MNLLRFLKNNLIILFLYLLLLGTAVYFVLNYERNNMHLYMNQYVGNRFVNAFFYYITYLGDGLFAALLLFTIVVVNVRLGFCATLSFLTGSAAAAILKYFFFDDNNRPFFEFQYIDKHQLNLVEGVDLHIHNSFPSGHAIQAFAILMCLAFATRNQLFKMLFLVLAVLTSLSRVYLSQHWLADVTAGSFIGMLCSLIFFFIFVERNRLARFDRTLPDLRRT